MILKYNHGGEVVEIPFSEEQPSGKCFAVRHNGSVFYAPIVDGDDASATNFKLVIGGVVYALGIEQGEVANPYAIFNTDETSVSLIGGVKNFNAGGYSTLATINAARIDPGIKVTLDDNNAEVFVHKAGKDILTNFDPDNDSVFLATTGSSMDKLTGVTVGNPNGITLQFGGNSNRLVFTDVANDAVISINGESYTFENDKFFTAGKSSGTLLTSTFDCTDYDNLATIDASKVSNSDITLSGERDELCILGFGDNTVRNVNASSAVSLPNYEMWGLFGISLGSESGITLQFNEYDDISRLILPDASPSATVTVNGSGWHFDQNIAIYNNYRAVVQLTPNSLFDCYNNPVYHGVGTLVANSGGTIKSVSYAMTMGGKNVSLDGYAGRQNVIICTGGNITVNGFDTHTTTPDYIRLLPGYTPSIPEYVSGGISLNYANRHGTSLGSIFFEDYFADSIKAGDVTYYFPAEGTVTLSGCRFNKTNARNATRVTVDTNYVDFGGMYDETAPNSYNVTLTNGTECFPSLESIVATQENSTIIGNYKANCITLVGGEENILVGGLGMDKYTFTSGGGIIHDFGVGSTKNGQGTSFTANSTVSSHNRFNATSYCESNDRVFVKGTICEIAYEPLVNTSTPTLNSVLAAYVTYDADGDTCGDYTILLDNIVKPYYSKNKWKTDFASMASIKASDTSSGKSLILGSAAVQALLVPKAKSKYPENIAKLDALNARWKAVWHA